jgi:hypothetical protein
MDARLAEHFPPEAEPAPVDLGPAKDHEVCGRISLSRSSELRITVQAARAGDPQAVRAGDRPWPARLVARLWYYNSTTRSWWPHASERGVAVAAQHARAFLAGVTAAVEALEADEHQRADERGESCGTTR